MRFFYALTIAYAGMILSGCPQDPVDPSSDSAQDVTSSDVPVAATGSVVINEIACAGVGEDWVEFYNKGDEPVDLGGWLFTDADPEHVFIFPDNTPLAAKGFLVIPRSATAGFDFGLGNADKVILYDSEGEKAHELVWNEGDAPAGTTFGFLPDGQGEPLTLYEPTPGAANASVEPACGNGLIEFNEVCDDTNFGGDTCASLGYKSGDLACTEDCTVIQRSGCVLYDTDVVVNEVSSEENDPIELVNIGDEEVDLTGWVLADKRGRLDEDAYPFKPGTVIGPGEFLVFEKNTDFNFGLGGDDAVMLYSAQGLVDLVDWESGEAAISFCRIPDGTGEFAPCSEATFGAENKE